MLISKGFKKFQKGKVPMFMDSGASDIMFVLGESFNDYKPIVPHTGGTDWAFDSVAVRGHPIPPHILDSSNLHFNTSFDTLLYIPPHCRFHG